MKKTKCNGKKDARLNNSRWAAYVTAGAATAAGCAATAEADIIYSGVIDRHFGPASFSSARFPVGGGATLRPRYIGPGYEGPSIGEALISVFRLPNGGSIAGFYTPNGNFASKLSFGQNVDARPFVAGSAILAVDLNASCQWLTPGTGFVGFRFTGAEGVQYGWARITVDGPAAGNTFTLVDYAVAEMGERITAGQTRTASVPESGGSLGLLALGCAGLLAWRAVRKS